jgi:uncharacterized protein (TIGR02271 family)
VGVFDNRADAERAVNELHRAGFRDDQIGYATKGDDVRTGGRAIEGTDTGEAGEGAAKGAVTGGVIGGILGALATGLIPGIGPVIAGGLLAGIIGGAAAGAAAGGLFGALVGSMGVPEEEARYYDQEFQSGRTVVTVKADGRYQDAYDILQRAGAYDFETRGTRTGTAATTGMTTGRAATTGTAAGMTGTTRPMTGERGTSERGRTVELREEELQARKDVQQVGEVTVRKDVVTEQESIDVPVTREEVFINRHPVDDRPADRPIAEGETIEVPVREERVEVEKRPVVYEEVEVGKRTTQETERVTDTVRREEARIEREGDVNVADTGTGAGMRASGFRSWDEVSPTYRQEWERRYGSSGMRWHEVEPYRRYSYEMAHDPRYQGRTWTEVEPELRTGYGDWSKRYGYRNDESAWDRFKDQMRSAWEETKQTARGR